MASIDKECTDVTAPYHSSLPSELKNSISVNKIRMTAVTCGVILRSVGLVHILRSPALTDFRHKRLITQEQQVIESFPQHDYLNDVD